ncbi:MAG TPA: glycosyltransferase family 39 protein [Thermomicrobiales bacterium]|jgi:4-amino-4-deoxy-L-arabinose transferase-like glycosyltransferase|nr:glycosyltransferase family 39 protein [Thermomicrobiales bacterium]
MRWLHALTAWYRVPTRDLLIGAALFGLALWVGLGHVATTQFHRDEARWVGRAYFIEELFNPGSETWADAELTRNQPPLASYLMGVGLVVQGRDPNTTPRNLLYDFGRSERWNQLRGRIPATEDISAGRRTDSFVGAALILLVYTVARRLTNRVGGTIAALALIPNPLYIYLSSLANSDMLLTVCVVAAAAAGLALARRPTWWRAVLLGVMLGLGTSTKLSPMLVAVVVAAYGVLLLVANQPWRRRDDEDRIRLGMGLMLMTVPFTAFATFVLSYPYLWADPIRRIIYMFEFRSSEMENQGELWQDRQVAGTFDAIERLRQRMAEQFSVSSWLSGEVRERIGWGWTLPDADLLLGAAGFGLLFLLAAHYGLRSPHALVILLLGSQVAVTIAGLQADFERYYLPILATFAIAFGVLIGQLWDWRQPVFGFARHRLRRRSGQVSQVTDGALTPVSGGLLSRYRQRVRPGGHGVPSAPSSVTLTAARTTPDRPPAAAPATTAFRTLVVSVVLAVTAVVAQMVAVTRSRQ